MTRQIITIDGPTCSGKTTIGKNLSQALGWNFMSTGLQFRAVALNLLDAGRDPADELAAYHAAYDLELRDDGSPAGYSEDDLKSVEVTRAASIVAKHPTVRRTLRHWQHMFAWRGPVVTEGRDQYEVFPDAGWSFWLSASAEVRATRRAMNMSARGEAVNYQQVLAEIVELDRRDAERGFIRTSQIEVMTETCQVDDIVRFMVNITREVEA